MSVTPAPQCAEQVRKDVTSGSSSLHPSTPAFPTLATGEWYSITDELDKTSTHSDHSLLVGGQLSSLPPNTQHGYHTQSESLSTMQWQDHTVVAHPVIGTRDILDYTPCYDGRLDTSYWAAASHPPQDREHVCG